MNTQVDGNSDDNLCRIMVQGNYYAVNLVWTASDNITAAKISKQELVFQLESELSCKYIPSKGFVQFGVADSNTESAHNLPVLSTSIEHPEKKSFCGAWKTDDNIWVVIGKHTSEGVIADHAFTNRDDAIREFNTTLLQSDWEAVLVPDEDWGIIPSDDYYQLENLIIKKIRFRLKNKKKQLISNAIKSGLVIAVLAGIYAGYSYWNAIQIKKAEEARRQEELMNIRNKPKVVRAPPPWLSQPGKADFINQCMNAIVKYKLSTTMIPGWDLDDRYPECNIQQINYWIKRGSATKNWFEFMKDEIWPKPTINIESEDHVRLSWPMKFSKMNYDKTEYTFDQVGHYLEQQFNELQREKIDFSSPINDDKNVGWMERTFKLSAKQDPNIYLPIFSKISNLVFTKLSYESSTDQWDLDGILYNKSEDKIEN